MSSSVSPEPKAGKWQFHLAAPLYLSPHSFESPFGDEWLLYAPDAEGLPVLVPDRLRRLLREFTGGSSLAAALGGVETAGRCRRLSGQ